MEDGRLFTRAKFRCGTSGGPTYVQISSFRPCIPVHSATHSSGRGVGSYGDSGFGWREIGCSIGVPDHVELLLWCVCNLADMKSSTTVNRDPNVEDDKHSPAKVLTANKTPSFVRSFEDLPMPMEDFVRNFGVGCTTWHTRSVTVIIVQERKTLSMR